MTGQPLAGMEQLDREVIQHLRRWSIPGASLAIARNGRLVYARGYGLADTEKKLALQPDSLFRIASISKSLTAVAAFKLVQDGKLKLDAKVFEILNDLKPYGSSKVDERIEKITVRDLLQCSAGWYKIDPLFEPQQLRSAAAACNSGFPPELSQVLRYWMASPLDFDPGTSYGYSNFDYALLGQVIEHVSGKSYEKYLLEDVLKPMGISHMRTGRTLSACKGEVHYYPCPGEPRDYSLFSQKKELVSWEYGSGFALELVKAPAGWVSSTIDELRFVSSVATERNGAPLNKETAQVMFARPQLPNWKDKHGYFACGWEVYVSPSGMMFSRVGSMPGSVSFVVHKFDGTSWAVAFNSRSCDQASMMSEFKKIVWRNIASQKHWPTSDLFEKPL